MLMLYGVRSQERAMTAILHQQKATRMELERLALALDSLLADRMLNEDDAPGAAARQPLSSMEHDKVKMSSPESLVPGIDRLLLERRPQEKRSMDISHGVRNVGLPDMKL